MFVFILQKLAKPGLRGLSLHFTIVLIKNPPTENLTLADSGRVNRGSLNSGDNFANVCGGAPLARSFEKAEELMIESVLVHQSWRLSSCISDRPLKLNTRGRQTFVNFAITTKVGEVNPTRSSSREKEREREREREKKRESPIVISFFHFFFSLSRAPLALEHVTGS